MRMSLSPNTQAEGKAIILLMRNSNSADLSVGTNFVWAICESSLNSLVCLRKTRAKILFISDNLYN